MRIAVYGDIDLNLVDGSAVWLASLVETLGLGPDQIRLFLKAPRDRDLHIARLDELASVSMVAAGRGPSPATPEQALDTIEHEDRDDRFRVIIIRGFRAALAAAGRPQLRGRLWVYLTDIPQAAESFDEGIRSSLGAIADASRYLLCQTEELRTFLETYVPEACRRTALLPPMIPDAGAAPSREARVGPRTMVYAGKFAQLWATLEMVEVFRAIRAEHPEFELHVYGDKIQRSRTDPGYENAMAEALTGTPGVRWHGAVPRHTLLDEIPTMDVAWAWRQPELADSLELSTKLLEYGAAGVPAIVNRTPIHEQLLGSDYPLFAATLDDAAGLLRHAWVDPALLDRAAAGLYARARAHTFAAVRERRLEPLLRRSRRLAKRPKVILVAGHDLKFASSIMRELSQRGHTVLVDQWRNHSSHDVDQSAALLERADTVMAEWCLGNAVWYSTHLPPTKRLVVRFHAQELRTTYPAELRLDSVAAMVFVSPHMRDQAADAFGFSADRLAVVPNAIDPVDLDRPKLPGAGLNLGMLGHSPASKGLARVLDLLEQVRAIDDRYVLFLKGRMPWDYPWLWERAAEREYFDAAFERIRRSPLLRGAVVFDADGPDVAAWLRKVGTLVSASDNESFHLAVAEGAASGALPVVIEWPGARDIYPEEWIVPDVSAAVGRVRDGRPGESVKQGTRRFELPMVTDRLEEILIG